MTGGMVGILLVIGVIVLYVGTYVLNRNTEVPEGVIPASKCSTCGSGSCSIREEDFSGKSETEEC